MNKLKLKAFSIFALSALLFSAHAAEHTTYYVDDNGEIQETTVDIYSGVESRDLNPTVNIEYDYEGLTRSDSTSNTGGGALRNTVSKDVTVTGDFVANSFDRTGTANNGGGGAVYNTGTITIVGDFIGNTLTGGNGNSTGVGGGAIYNSSGTITVYGDFVSNTSSGAGTTGGGAIYNTGTGVVNLYNSSFIDNYQSSNGTGGGAIYNTANATVNLYAQSSNIYFIGNTYASTSNAIYNAGTVNFSATNAYKIVVNDGINGTTAGKLNILAGTTVFNNTVVNQTITVSEGATLELGTYAGNELLEVATSSANLSSSTLTVNGTLSLVVSTTSSTITLGSIAFGENSTFALELSDIFGSFELNIEGDSLDLDNLGLDIILADGSIEKSTFVDGTYDLTTESYEDSYITIEKTDTGYTITGVVGAAVPEPSTYAMILGAFALGFAYYRRRK